MDLLLSPSKVRRLLRTPRFAAVSRISCSLTGRARGTGRLLVVGSASYEPWHLVAHLGDAGDALGPARLLRHMVPTGAAPHLSLGLAQLALATRHDSVLVVAPDSIDDDLLERLADARRRGSALFALTQPEACPGDLTALTDDAAQLHDGDFDLGQHLLPRAASR